MDLLFASLMKYYGGGLPYDSLLDMRMDRVFVFKEMADKIEKINETNARKQSVV